MPSSLESTISLSNLVVCCRYICILNQNVENNGINEFYCCLAVVNFKQDQYNIISMSDFYQKSHKIYTFKGYDIWYRYMLYIIKVIILEISTGVDFTKYTIRVSLYRKKVPFTYLQLIKRNLFILCSVRFLCHYFLTSFL